MDHMIRQGFQIWIVLCMIFVQELCSFHFPSFHSIAKVSYDSKKRIQSRENFFLAKKSQNNLLIMRMAVPQLQTKGEAARKKKKEAQKQVEIQTITQTQTEVQVKREVKKKARKVTDVKKELDKMWRVLLLNDNIHSIDDVEDYLAQVRGDES